MHVLDDTRLILPVVVVLIVFLFGIEYAYIINNVYYCQHYLMNAGGLLKLSKYDNYNFFVNGLYGTNRYHSDARVLLWLMLLIDTMQYVNIIGI